MILELIKQRLFTNEFVIPCNSEVKLEAETISICMKIIHRIIQINMSFSKKNEAQIHYHLKQDINQHCSFSATYSFHLFRFLHNTITFIK